MNTLDPRRSQRSRKERAPSSWIPPFVVGTLHSAACLRKLSKAPEEIFQVIDLLEARLDSLPLDSLPSRWPLPVIATARHPEEGGEGSLTSLKRQQLLEEALPWAFAIDIEWRSRKQLASTMEVAKKTKRLVILSFHDFYTLPPQKRLTSMLLEAKERGADIFKVACRINTKEELLALIDFQIMAETQFPAATMGMGPGGKLSRLLLPLFGSMLSYGWLAQAQLEGQWSALEIAAHFRAFEKEISLAARTGVEPVRQP